MNKLCDLLMRLFMALLMWNSLLKLYFDDFSLYKTLDFIDKNWYFPQKPG